MDKKEKMQLLLEAMARVNPLAISEEYGGDKMASFQTPHDCYTDALFKLKTLFPGGYVDLVLFMNKWQNVSVVDANRIVGVKQYAEVCWNAIFDKERNYKIREIFRVLHRYTGAYMIDSDLDEAINRLDKVLIATPESQKTQHCLIHFKD